MNLPNKLTMFRVILVPFVVAALLVQQFGRAGDIAALVFFIIASLTDFADGYIARKYHLITNFGKFMDPLADKLLVCSAMICLVALGRLPAWIVIVVICREFTISGFRLIAAENGIVIAASWWGKWKTVSQMALVILRILNIDHPVFSALSTIVMYAALILTVISLVDYIMKNKSVLKEQG